MKENYHVSYEEKVNNGSYQNRSTTVMANSASEAKAKLRSRKSPNKQIKNVQAWK